MALMVRARSTNGNESWTSARRIRIAPGRPSTKPATSPSEAPESAVKATVQSPMKSAMRAP